MGTQRKSHTPPVATEVATRKVNIEKWGREPIEAGFTLVPNVLIERQKKLGLDPLDLNILLHLMSRWWEVGNKPHPSKKSIAAAVGRSPRTVQRRIEEMEKGGLLHRERRQGTNRGTQTNRYHLDGLVKAAVGLAKEELENRKSKQATTGRMRPLRLVR